MPVFNLIYDRHRDNSYLSQVEKENKFMGNLFEQDHKRSCTKNNTTQTFEEMQLNNFFKLTYSTR